MRGPFCFYSKFDFLARLSRFVVGQVFTRVWPVDSCCNSFLAARWGIAATHLSKSTDAVIDDGPNWPKGYIIKFYVRSS